jgi:2-isopropylmalate synthase
VALERAFTRFKALADRKKDLFDGDIEMLMLRPAGPGNGPWMLTGLTTATHRQSVSTASVRVEHVDGQAVERTAEGDGPVDAAFKAMAAAVGIAVKLRTFEIRSVSAGEDAQGEAVVCVDYEQRSYRGSSVSTNIVESSTRAFLDVLNQIALRESLVNRQGRFTAEPLPAPG